MRRRLVLAAMAATIAPCHVLAASAAPRARPWTNEFVTAAAATLK